MLHNLITHYCDHYYAYFATAHTYEGNTCAQSCGDSTKINYKGFFICGGEMMCFSDLTQVHNQNTYFLSTLATYNSILEKYEHSQSN